LANVVVNDEDQPLTSHIAGFAPLLYEGGSEIAIFNVFTEYGENVSDSCRGGGVDGLNVQTMRNGSDVLTRRPVRSREDVLLDVQSPTCHFICQIQNAKETHLIPIETPG
jgi:hypothetical protein